MLIKTAAASNIKPRKNRGKNHGSCSKISKNYKATPAFESFISRNNCLFILCSLWICNQFLVVVSSVLAAVWCGEKVEPMGFHQKGLSDETLTLDIVYVGQK